MGNASGTCDSPTTCKSTEMLHEPQPRVGLHMSASAEEIVSSHHSSLFSGCAVATDRFGASLEPIEVTVADAEASKIILSAKFLPTDTILHVKQAICTKNGVPVVRQVIGPTLQGEIKANPLGNKCSVREASDLFEPLMLTMSLAPGPFALTGTVDGVLSVLDLAKGRCILDLRRLRAHSPPVHCMAVDWQAQRALIGLALWDLGTCERICDLEHPLPEVACVAMDWSMRLAVSGNDDGLVQLWDLEHFQLVREFKPHSRKIHCIDVQWGCPLRAISASKDGSLQLLDLKHGTSLRELSGHTSWVQCVAVDWSNQRALSGGADATLRLWDVSTATVVRELSGHTSIIQCLAACWPQQRAVSGGMDNSILVWNLESGHCVRTLNGHSGWVNCLSVNWKDDLLCSTDALGNVVVWRLESADLFKRWKPHERSILCIDTDWSS